MHLDSVLNNYITIIAVLLIAFLMLSLMNRYLPVPKSMKRILGIIVIAGVIIWLLDIFDRLEWVINSIRYYLGG